MSSFDLIIDFTNIYKLKKLKEKKKTKLIKRTKEFSQTYILFIKFYITGPPLYIGMDLSIASFDSISEVNMVGLDLLLIFLFKSQP